MTTSTTALYGAGLWDLMSEPGAVPVRAEQMLPGAHVVAATAPEHADVIGIALRRAGFEVRDTIVWMCADGHRLLTMARAPMKGTIVQNVLTYGVGGLHVDACRVPIGDADREASEAKNAHTKFGTGPRENHVWGTDSRDAVDWNGDAGRFPTNLLLQHHTTCTPVGTTMAPGDNRAATHTPGSRPGGFADIGAEKGDTRPNARLYPAAAVLVYECAATCPVSDLDARSGERRAGVFPPARGKSVSSNLGHTGDTVGGYRLIGDVGGASRYFPRFAATEEVWAWLERLLVPEGARVSRAA